jgi:hypothetical protein
VFGDLGTNKTGTESKVSRLSSKIWPFTHKTKSPLSGSLCFVI